jgi:tripartite-type tricarboxylate transporter receptor subunit TctC
MKKLLYSVALSLSMIAGTSIASSTKEWPNKSVKIVVPFGPGGPNDVVARELAKQLTSTTGQTFVVENKPGAASVIGSNYVAKASPDGYTFLFTSGNIASLPATKNLPFDLKTALTPVARIGGTPYLLIVRKNFPASTLKELISYAKANPEKINYGTAGKGDITELMTENFASRVGIKLTAVPYKGSAAASLDLVAGHIDMQFTSPGTIKNTVAAELPKIAITSDVRSPDFPTVPTIKEQFGKDYSFNIWFGLFAPSGVDKKIAQELNSRINKILETPEFSKFLMDRSITPQPSSPAELHKLLLTEIDQWTTTARRIGIRPE